MYRPGAELTYWPDRTRAPCSPRSGDWLAPRRWASARADKVKVGQRVGRRFTFAGGSAELYRRTSSRKSTGQMRRVVNLRKREVRGSDLESTSPPTAVVRRPVGQHEPVASPTSGRRSSHGGWCGLFSTQDSAPPTADLAFEIAHTVTLGAKSQSERAVDLAHVMVQPHVRVPRRIARPKKSR